MWIRPEVINHDSSNKRIVDSSLLYYITTSKHVVFEMFLKSKTLYYCIRNDSNNLGNI